MGKRNELIYGFENDSGIAKKVAKISISTQSNNLIKDLYIFQYDMTPMFHWSLHNDTSRGKKTRYHLQTEHLSIIAKDDRDQFPMLLAEPLPDFTLTGKIYNLQLIHIHLKADDINNIYPDYSQKEQNENSNRIANFTNLKYDKRTVGYLDLHLISVYDKQKIDEFKDTFDNLYLCDVYDQVKPNIIAVVQFFNFL